MAFLRAQADAALTEGRRADLLFKLGRVAAEHQDDEQEAVIFMERALAQSPLHIASLRFLADYYLRESQWVDARPVLESLASVLENPDSDTIRTTSSGIIMDPTQLTLIWNQLGQVLVELSEPEKAHAVYSRVVEFDAENIQAQKGLAKLAWLSRDYDKAQKTYRTILDLHGKTLNEKEHATIRAHLGEIAAERGDIQHSRELLENALEMDASNPDTVRELISTCTKQEDWESVAKYQAQLAGLLDTPLERFSVLMELAQTYRSELERFDDARQALEEAKELKPNSQVVPVQLLEVFLALERYKDAVDILLDLVSPEEDPKRKAAYTYTLAIIHRDNIHDARKAVSFLNDTLDLDPSRLEAFEALDRILVERKDWQGQADSYRAMIERVQNTEQDALEFRLRKNLAQIYRTVLDQPDEELQELLQAVRLKPGDLEVHGFLARALERQDPASDAAVREHRRILKVDPNALESWKALSRIYARQKRRDAVWCVCGVLILLDNADETEHAFYMRHQQPSLALKRGISGVEQWESSLFTSGQDVLLGRIFALIAAALGDAVANRKLSDLGLTAQDAVNLKQKSRFSSFLTTVSKVLGVPLPPVYRDINERGLRKVALGPLSLVAGPDVLTGRKGKELRFSLGKAMAYFLPAHLLAGIFPAGHMRTLLIAGMTTVLPESTQGGEPGVKGIQKQLEASLSETAKKELRALVVELTDREVAPYLNEWLRHVEMTANHAGHLLCNDLEVSVRMLKEERESGHSWSKLFLKDAISELALYTISEPFLALRDELGAAITE
jgi:tetratricopeptide (TPR) repeat protein